jgi:hypothetical protein
MDKVAEFYARWFAKKPAQEYSAAEAASEELAKEAYTRANHIQYDGRRRSTDVFRSWYPSFMPGRLDPRPFDALGSWPATIAPGC